VVRVFTNHVRSSATVSTAAFEFLGAKRSVNLKPFLSGGNYSFGGFIVIKLSAKQGFGP
jgi:hypothetical protein